MKVYLSGKISGLPEAEYKPMFFRAQSIMEDRGHAVVNPLTLPHDHDKSWASYMMENLAALIQCDSIAMLPNWAESPGAKIEFAFAERMGKHITFLMV